MRIFGPYSIHKTVLTNEAGEAIIDLRSFP